MDNLGEEDARLMAEYEAIIAFEKAIFEGTHPTIKVNLTPEQIAQRNANWEARKNEEKATMCSDKNSAPAAPAEQDAAIENMEYKNAVTATAMQSSVPENRHSRFNVDRDYYRDLGLEDGATKDELIAAGQNFLDMSNGTFLPYYKEAYMILYNDKDREMYRLARRERELMTRSTVMKELIEDLTITPSSEVEIDYAHDYYRDLGLTDGATYLAIHNAFTARETQFSSSSKNPIAKRKWKSENEKVRQKISAQWEVAQKARDILLNAELKKKYDSGRTHT